MHEIPRLSRPDTATFLDRFGRPGQPAILTGLADHWPALSRWNFDFFRQRYGTLRVTVKREAQRLSEQREMSMAEYIDYLLSTRDPSPFYLASWDFMLEAPELAEDFQLPEYWRDDWLQQVSDRLRPRLLWLFIGPAGTGFRMHVDVGHTAAWNVQLHGRKRWAMFPPEQFPLLYHGRVDAFAPDLERFPDFARSLGHYAVQEAGEAVFVPSGWWHQTQILEPSLAVSGNYANATNLPLVLAWLEKEQHLELHAELAQLGSA